MRTIPTNPTFLPQNQDSKNIDLYKHKPAHSSFPSQISLQSRPLQAKLWSKEKEKKTMIFLLGYEWQGNELSHPSPTELSTPCHLQLQRQEVR